MLGKQKNERDLSIVIVSTNEAHWLDACLTTRLRARRRRQPRRRRRRQRIQRRHARAGRADASRRRASCAAPTAASPTATTARWMTCTWRATSLCLNPDTEIVDGNFGELVEMLDARPEIGLVGVKQLDRRRGAVPDRAPLPERRARFRRGLRLRRAGPSSAGLGRAPARPRRYESELECDWTTGAYMLIRREALLGAGFMDERFFLYSDEPDLCLRISRAGWRIMHSPRDDDRPPRGQGRRSSPGSSPRTSSPGGSTPRSTSPRHTVRLYWARWRRATPRGRSCRAGSAAAPSAGPPQSCSEHPDRPP